MWILVPLAAIGLALGRLSRERPMAPVVLLGLTALYFTAVPAATQWPEERYRLPVDPLLFVFPVAGVWELRHRFQALRSPPPA